MSMIEKTTFDALRVIARILKELVKDTDPKDREAVKQRDKRLAELAEVEHTLRPSN